MTYLFDLEPGAKQVGEELLPPGGVLVLLRHVFPVLAAGADFRSRV